VYLKMLMSRIDILHKQRGLAKVGFVIEAKSTGAVKEDSKLAAEAEADNISKGWSSSEVPPDIWSQVQLMRW
jgi:hypothetical protein